MTAEARIELRLKPETKELMENTAQVQEMTLSHLLRESFSAFWFDWVIVANRAIVEGRDIGKEWQAFRMRHPDLKMPLRRT